MPTSVPGAGAGRAEGRAERQDQPREPILWEGLQSCHVICEVRVEGKNKMETCGPFLYQQHIHGQCEQDRLVCDGDVGAKERNQLAWVRSRLCPLPGTVPAPGTHLNWPGFPWKRILCFSGLSFLREEGKWLSWINPFPFQSLGCTPRKFQYQMAGLLKDKFGLSIPVSGLVILLPLEDLVGRPCTLSLLIPVAVQVGGYPGQLSPKKIWLSLL